MKQEYQDQIDKYVLGQMDDTEKSVFEQDVAQDAGLQIPQQLYNQISCELPRCEQQGLLLRPFSRPYRAQPRTGA